MLTETHEERAGLLFSTTREGVGARLFHRNEDPPRVVKWWVDLTVCPAALKGVAHRAPRRTHQRMSKKTVCSPHGVKLPGALNEESMNIASGTESKRVVAFSAKAVKEKNECGVLLFIMVEGEEKKLYSLSPSQVKSLARELGRCSSKADRN